MDTKSEKDSLRSNTDVARELFQDYTTFRMPGITARRFGQAAMLRWLQPLQEQGVVATKPIGQSAEGRTISLLSMGNGEENILLWSQMHGDEPTATMALMDILSFFSREPRHAVAGAILENLRLLIIPMLNPDGAERFQRRTVQAIDMNRDALSLETPEARILKETCDEYRPRFGFNLHDQDPRYTVGNTNKVSAIALLAPAFDEARSDNDVRLAAKRVASVFATAMQEFIPGHISKYDDSFEPRAFGDNIQKWGTSTVLVESGGWPGDREKMFIRKLNAVGILTSLFSLSVGSHVNASVAVYDQLPFNTKNLYDIVLRRGSLKSASLAQPVAVDVGINLEEAVDGETGNVNLTGTIVDIGDLHFYGAFEDVSLDGRLLPAELIRMDRRLSLEEIGSLMKKL